MSFLPLSHPQPRQSPSPSHPAPSLLPSALPETPADRQNSPDPEPNITEEGPTETDPIQPPADFAPFFTLLSDTASSVTHHPTVHYIFSDDVPDNDPITAAAFEILDPPSSTTFPTRNSESGKQNTARNGEHTKERYVLLDMDDTGSRIVSAQSMSPDWAVTSTELAPAPTWDDRGGEGARGEGERSGLMLRIEGVGVQGSIEKDGGEVEGEEKRLEELVEVYERRMGDLRRVVEAGAGVGVARGEDEG